MSNQSGEGGRMFFGTGRIVLMVVLIFLAGLSIWKWAPDGEPLKSWGAYLSGAGTIGLVAGALYAASVAVYEYRRGRETDQRRISLEKARWLSEMFQSFYERGEYKRIRRKIDFDEIEDIRELLRKDQDANPRYTESEQTLFDEFTDFMNLFEFVAYLKSLNQLDGEDIKAMFAYYLERIVEVDQDRRIRKYLESNGYGNLSKLLKTYET